MENRGYSVEELIPLGVCEVLDRLAKISHAYGKRNSVLLRHFPGAQNDADSGLSCGARLSSIVTQTVPV
jgi:hypothetical protein